MIIVKRSTTVEEPATRPPVEPRLGLGVMLIGSDGSTWDLYNGPVRLLAGASGFGPTDPEHWWRTSPALDGSQWQNMRTPHKQLTLPMYIHTKKSLEWADTAEAFFAAVDPSDECSLLVARPDGIVRTIPMRFESGGDVQYDVDPLVLRFGAYQFTFVAPDPYWQGQAVTTRFEIATTGNLFPGPPFNINPGNSIDSGSVTNPGDREAWPVWTAYGPFTAVTLGVGSDVVSLTTSAAAGEGVVVDMDPRRQTIRDLDGNDLWSAATAADFAAIPAGSDVPLTMDVTSPGSGTAIELAFTPRHRLAW